MILRKLDDKIPCADLCLFPIVFESQYIVRDHVCLELS